MRIVKGVHRGLTITLVSTKIVVEVLGLALIWGKLLVISDESCQGCSEIVEVVNKLLTIVHNHNIKCIYTQSYFCELKRRIMLTEGIHN